MMVEDTVSTCAQYLSPSRGGGTPEHWLNIFHILVIRCKIRSPVWWVSNRDKGGVFHTGDIFPKTGNPVLELLQ